MALRRVWAYEPWARTDGILQLLKSNNSVILTASLSQVTAYFISYIMFQISDGVYPELKLL
jgi:hypothetical protein